MIAIINNFQVDLSKPIDISIPLSNTDANPIAWYVDKPEIEPVRFGEVGKVSSGMSSTNFNNILLIPMDMERTLNVHITSDFYSVNQSFFFTAELVSIELEDQKGFYCYQRSPKCFRGKITSSNCY
jgi:hypothetical protein